MFTILDSDIKLRAYLSLSQPLSKFLAYKCAEGAGQWLQCRLFVWVYFCAPTRIQRSRSP